jgi:hypothetical protein
LKPYSGSSYHQSSSDLESQLAKSLLQKRFCGAGQKYIFIETYVPVFKVIEIFHRALSRSLRFSDRAFVFAKALLLYPQKPCLNLCLLPQLKPQITPCKKS